MARRKKSKGGRKCKLTAETETIVLEAIAKGAFAHVAAAAAGIDPATLRRYLASTSKRFRAFQAAVAKAKAGARKAAEAVVFAEDPLSWLRLGPGRDWGEREIGWTEPAKRLEHSGPGGGPLQVQNETKLDVQALLADPEALDLSCRLLERLDARKTVAGGAGAVRDGREVEALEAPRPPQP
jgi:hypothetical protein